jgi:hypothetical protein
LGNRRMQYENGTAWSPPPAQERPDFGTTSIPDGPGYLMPSPGALHLAFGNAIAELEHRRGRKPRSSGYAAQSQEAVFEAGLRALAGRVLPGSSLVTIPKPLHCLTKLFPRCKHKEPHSPITASSAAISCLSLPYASPRPLSAFGDRTNPTGQGFRPRMSGISSELPPYHQAMAFRIRLQRYVDYGRRSRRACLPQYQPSLPAV